MWSLMYWNVLVLLCFFQFGEGSKTPPIIVQGSKMYNSVTGERFIIKGITYEYAVDDEYFELYGENVIDNVLKDLQGHYNTIRFYNINPDKSYAKVMTKLSSLGIYAMPSASPGNGEYYGAYRYATMRKDLGPNPTSDSSDTCYPAQLLQYGKRVLANFANYDNTLAIVTSNEIMQKDLTAAACAKQYIADLKNWMRTHWSRIRLIPLAYAAADSAHDPSKIDADAYNAIKVQGLLCGDTQVLGVSRQSVDIFLLNSYRWVVGETFASAYQRLVNWAQGMPIVIALGEFGAKQSRDKIRDWAMVPYMLKSDTANSKFDQLYSGGTAYSYGFADLDLKSTFPFILGGGQRPTDNPGSTSTEDYRNLVKIFKSTNYAAQLADWDEVGKCKYIPPLPLSISATSPKSVLDYGWNITDCSTLKLPGDKGGWKAASRDGAVCTNNGAPCDVVVDSFQTTQKDICGFNMVAIAGGAQCNSDSDCSTNGGRCISLKCECKHCYTGDTCATLDFTCAITLPNYNGAVPYVFTAIGICVATFAVSFVLLYFQWLFHLKERRQIENQVKGLFESNRMRNPM